MVFLAIYAGYCMTRRTAQTTVDETATYTPVLPTASVVAVEVASEVYGEAVAEEENNSNSP